MKNFSFSIYNVASLASIFILIMLILFPFNLINLEQAQRIAKWKSAYENIKYSFSLIKLHEGRIIPTQEEAGKIISDELILSEFAPYFNLKSDKIINPYKHGYRKMNGSRVVKNAYFYFDKFVERKDGILLGLKQNPDEVVSEKQPLFYMMVDINGIEKPNRIGQDIFIINIFRDHITPKGDSKPYTVLNANCSPIGNGLYCSNYYLLGGRF